MFLQSSPLCGSSQTPYSLWDYWPPSSPHILSSWNHLRHQTRDPFHLTSEEILLSSPQSLVSLSSGFQPQTNDQIEWANQNLEAALRCITASNPSAWSTQFTCIKYAHNSLTSVATGMSPLNVLWAINPFCFPLQKMRSPYLWSRPIYADAERSERMLTLPCSTSLFATGIYHWPPPDSCTQLLTRSESLPFFQRYSPKDSKELSPHYIGPFEIESIINPSAIKWKLPRSMRIRPTFHISQWKPVPVSPLHPPADPPSPARVIDDHPAYTVWCHTSRFGVFNTSSTGRDTVLKTPPSLWLPSR